MGQAWHSGDSRPLRARYEEVATELAALGRTPETPITEQALFNNIKLLERIKPPPSRDDPALRAAGAEFYNLKNRYRIAAAKVSQLQARLSGSVTDWLHKALGDVPTGWDLQWPPELADTDAHADAAATRAAVGQAAPLVLRIEALQNALDQALIASHRDPDVLHRQLLEKLFARVEALERAAAQQNNAIVERLDDLEARVTRVEGLLKLKNRRVPK